MLVVVVEPDEPELEPDDTGMGVVVTGVTGVVEAGGEPVLLMGAKMPLGIWGVTVGLCFAEVAVEAADWLAGARTIVAGEN